jgi:hypothetical protein
MGVGPSLSDEPKHAAGEDFSQLLTALDGGQIGRQRVRWMSAWRHRRGSQVATPRGIAY